MIGTSFSEYLFIRISILFVRYTHLFYAALLLAVACGYGAQTGRLLVTWILCGLLVAEAAYAFTIYRPFQKRLLRRAVHPPPLPRAERRALFERCIGDVASPRGYLSGWFLGADLEHIRRDNVKEFLLWAFFDREVETFDGDEEKELAEELEEYIGLIEQGLGYTLGEGRGPAKSLRLTFDAITTKYRSLTWYCVMFLVDQLTHMLLSLHGFQYYARSAAATLGIFPPRLQELLAHRRSPATSLGYWHQPHCDENSLPLVFFHGIGVGLWTYIKFITEVHAAAKGNTSIGIIAIEILPISFRLTAPPPDKSEFLNQMTSILDYHGWHNFSIVSHSYGSVLTTHMLRDASLRKRTNSVVLIDPVTIGLHLPDVAFNFTRRLPKRANEWQLWYFASTDPSVALCLGRHFFWRENIIWKEELLATEEDSRSGQPKEGSKTAVCLSGRDLIVNTAAVAQYLDGVEGVEAVIFPQLDHAQIFDDATSRQRVVQLVKSYCSKGRSAGADDSLTYAL
ncbi:hypothetical protein HJFPF1_09244 [Paramyrothecium foliicola]|nr:hypothetical protein HJFPF1_09244 [Paramyrothecium foliicola]